MWHRHHPISRETPTLCTAQSRGFVFILRSLAPSARDVAAEVKHHRKATAALLLPSAALEPKVERMCRFKLRFKLHSPGGGQIESVALVVCAIQFVQFVIAVRSSGVDFASRRARSQARGAFFEELAVSSQKLRGSGRNLPAFLPKVRRCFPSLRLFSAQRVAVCKKSPAVCLTAGECRLRRASQGAWR